MDTEMMMIAMMTMMTIWIVATQCVEHGRGMSQLFDIHLLFHIMVKGAYDQRPSRNARILQPHPAPQRRLDQLLVSSGPRARHLPPGGPRLL